MADASALFAKKKGKKKKFKSFNANKADASEVFSSTHVDDEQANKKSTVTTEDNDWGEAQKKKTLIATAGAPKLGEFSSLDDQVKIGDEIDISEKIRIEETRKQLEAVRLKAQQGPEEPEKEPEKAPAPPPTLANGGLSSLESASRSGFERPSERAARIQAEREGGGSTGGSSLSSLAGAGGAPGKYVPKHRQGGASLSDNPPLFANTRFSAGGGSGNTSGIRKVDTSDESAFPTLGGGKTVVASGAWGAPKVEAKKEEEEEVEKDEGEKEKEEEGEGDAKKDKKKKKKKKDLDAFSG
ncbi:hypothetical protein TrLO_g11725 [Triparma laevis f. longispina]|uniref:Uncharacterized protein n=1 Tax=Triparma laevis f. longispina TaxID=1714387 RepID=A0A9W7DWF7_9STRA|nr:hypothetical protein TrLO_g11725 [Triparma laevis f. longispina]